MVIFFRIWAEARFSSTSSIMRAGSAIASEVHPVQDKGQPAAQLIDINTATSDALMSLPGIGPKLAQAIIDYREAHGPFQSLDALLRVKGIGAKRLKKISPLLFIKPTVK